MKIKEKIPSGGEREQMMEQVTETTFQRIRMIKRGTLCRNESDSSDSDIPLIEWRDIDKYITANPETRTSPSPQKKAPKFISFWNLNGSERAVDPEIMLEFEAHSRRQTQMLKNRKQTEKTGKKGRLPLRCRFFSGQSGRRPRGQCCCRKTSWPQIAKGRVSTSRKR